MENISVSEEDNESCLRLVSLMHSSIPYGNSKVDMLFSETNLIRQICLQVGNGERAYSLPGHASRAQG